MSILVLRTSAPKKEIMTKDIMPTPAGKAFRALLAEAGIKQEDTYYATVFETALASESGYFDKKASKNVDLSFAPNGRGKYLKTKYVDELRQTQGEIKDLAPNLILCLGGLPTWALTGSGDFDNLRGTVVVVDGQKILPTYTPETLLKQWKLRPVIQADLMKAATEMDSPEHNFKTREIWIEPNLQDLANFYLTHLMQSSLHSIDIETAGGSITMVGFASDDGHAIVVPFLDKRKANYSYWDSPADEAAAWGWIQDVCANQIPIVGQNFMYDIQWLWKQASVQCRNYLHDTMLMHHALQPEMKKSLGFLGSIYTNSPAWKDMRTKDTALKAND